MRDLVRRYPKLLAFLALAVLGLIAYANALSNGFHFDDFEGIVSNTSLRDLRNIPSYFTSPVIFRFTRRLDWRPILQITYALDYAVGGPNAMIFHGTSLVFHIATAWLIFLIVARIGAGSPVHLSPAPAISMAWLSFAAAALFTVHTVNTQTVDYIWARSSLLAAFFYLLSFYCYLHGPFSGQDRKSPSWHLGALAAFALGLGCKATAISLPVMLVAYETLFLNPAGRSPLSLYLKEPRRLIKYLPVLAILLAYYLLRSEVTPKGTGRVVSTPWIGRRSTYLFTQFRAWIYYIKLYLWPDPLILDYPGFGWSTSLLDARVLASLTLVLAIVIAAWLVRRSQPMLSFFTFWFFIALLPEASIIVRPDQVTGHRPYLAYAGLSVAAAVLIFKVTAWLWRRLKRAEWPEARFQQVYLMALGLILIALSAATIRRNLDWRDEVTVWTDVLQKDPTNSRAYMILGHAYTEREEYGKAQEALERALQLDPGSRDVLQYRGNLNQLLGRYDQALSDLNFVLEGRRRSRFGFFQRGEVYRKMGRYDEALKDYRRVVQIDRRFADSYFGIAMVHWERKELPQATEACRKLLEVEPDAARSYTCLGSLLMHQSVFGEALKVYYGGVTRFPRNGTLWYGLGTAYEELGLYNEAQDAYGKSSSLARESSQSKSAHP